MSLLPGNKLGPYEIIERAGAGGMGEVYRARDTRLGRDVAIKILPPHLSLSSDARARLEREARTISQLNHPHICTLYDIGADGGRSYLVLEYIDGVTLATRLEAGAVPPDELIAIGLQITDALAKAHGAGVVHRDLKPGNLMLTQSGAKLLDFGLSRPSNEQVINPSLSQPETANVPLTTAGAFVGTLPYMAPEQLEGKEVDGRTDIFALGCVLYEMATGKRLFGGNNQVAVLSSILNSAPVALVQLDNSVPAKLGSIIRRCLERSPEQRYATARELNEELAKIKDWVRSEGIPELTRTIERIQSLDEGPEAWQAFVLAREIEKLAPDEPQLERLWSEFSRRLTITSNPTGVKVSAKYYGDPKGPWIELGTAPLENIRFPRGISRLKLELAGYRESQDLMWIIEAAVVGATDNKAALWEYRLVKPGEIPDEMEFIPSGEFPLFMPGLDHLKTEGTASFLMDRHPVTNREYKKFVEAGGYDRREYWQYPFATESGDLSWEDAISKFVDVVGQSGPAGWEMGEYPSGEDDFPVTGVSWHEAEAYAKWAGKELPTIFHWNRVAFAVASSQIIPHSNFGGKGVVAVGTTSSINRYGIHDLGGNVREWAWNQCNRPGERFILGGGWNDPEYAFTDAYAQSTFDRSATNSFRCIRATEPEPNAENLHREIDLPFRDFRAEKPVPDEVFSYFLRQYSYDKNPLNASIVEDIEVPVGRRQLITFAAAYGGEQMEAYLFLPSRARLPLQTVILFPGSLAIFANSVGPADFRRSDFLVKSGRAVMLPIYKGTYQRGDELKSDYPEETTFYKDHVIMWVKDLARSVDYLESREEFDASRLAYFGLSWGGAMGGILPAVEKRIKAVVLYVAGMNFQRALPEVDQINYVSRVTQPTLMLNGERDFYFPVETSQLPMYELLGAPPEHKKRLTYPLGHSVPRQELIKETLAWLDRYLGPVG
ncbi:MAG: protein kinase [Candidatus Zixiibacteriota bacterium]